MQVPGGIIKKILDCSIRVVDHFSGGIKQCYAVKKHCAVISNLYIDMMTFISCFTCVIPIAAFHSHPVLEFYSTYPSIHKS